MSILAAKKKKKYVHHMVAAYIFVIMSYYSIRSCILNEMYFVWFCNKKFLSLLLIWRKINWNCFWFHICNLKCAMYIICWYLMQRMSLFHWERTKTMLNCSMIWSREFQIVQIKPTPRYTELVNWSLHLTHPKYNYAKKSQFISRTQEVLTYWCWLYFSTLAIKK